MDLRNNSQAEQSRTESPHACCNAAFHLACMMHFYATRRIALKLAGGA